MKIVHVPRRFVASDWGGTETAVLEFAAGQRARGHDARIFCPMALAHQESDLMGGVPVQRFPYFYPWLGLDDDARRQLDLRGGNLFSFSLMRALRREPELNVLHLHTMKRLGGIVRTVARQRRLPYVVSIHGGLLEVPAGETERLLEPTTGALEWGRALGLAVGSRRVVQDASAVLCVSPQEQKRVSEAFPEQRVEFLPNGVDLERWAQGDGDAFRRSQGIPADAHVLLCVGRIDPQKNQGLLIDLLPQLMAKIPNVHLALVGHVTDQAYLDGLNARARELGVTQRLSLVPGLSPEGGALADAYHAADQFVLPSVHEPFGIVALEAWAAHRPVVVSDRGGLPAFVEDGRTGLLADPDDPGSFLRSIVRLADDPGLRGSLALAGNAEAREHYTWDRINQRLMGIYEDVAEARRRAA